MRAFHGDQAIKAFYVERMRAHMEEDELVRGIYWDPETHTGCGIGCTLEITDEEDIYEQFEPRLGIPCQLAYLHDYLFEHTPIDYYKAFPLAFYESITEGADLTLVTPRFLVWLLTDEQDGVIRFADEQGKNVIRRVASLHQRILDGGKVAKVEWAAAWEAASAATRYDARAATWHTTRAATSSATSAAARAAAWAAAWEASRTAAWDAATQRQAEKLLELLREAPVK